MTNRTINLGILGLVVVAGGLIAILYYQRRIPPSVPVSDNPVIQARNEDFKRFSDFAMIRPLVAPDDRIILFGDTLISKQASVLDQTIGDQLKLPIQRVIAEGQTSTDDFVSLGEVVKQPPKVLILDVVRFDQAADVTLDRTVDNINAFAAKFREIGIQAVFILGTGSDGSPDLAARIKSQLLNATTIDASTLLLSSKYRESPTSLNESGAKQLGQEIVDAVKTQLASGS